MKRIIILGATSGIGYEVAQLYRQMGWRIGIAGRRLDILQKMQAEAPQQIEIAAVDMTSLSATSQLDRLISQLGGVDIFLLSSGIGNQNKDLDPEIELSTVATNAVGFTRIVTYMYDYFRKQNRGHIAVISSIAGTKGLGSAPSYSATKRFQNTYIDALAQLSRMQKINITFTDIRPGFVKTAILKDDNYPMLMQPDVVARKIVRALERKKRRVIIDWRYAVMVFFWRLIPEWLWERMPVRNK